MDRNNRPPRRDENGGNKRKRDGASDKMPNNRSWSDKTASNNGFVRRNRPFMQVGRMRSDFNHSVKDPCIVCDSELHQLSRHPNPTLADGTLFGCPPCNSDTHLMTNCPKAPRGGYSEKEFWHFYRQIRQGMCPIHSYFDFREMKHPMTGQYTLEEVPLTPGFAMGHHYSNVKEYLPPARGGTGVPFADPFWNGANPLENLGAFGSREFEGYVPEGVRRHWLATANTRRRLIQDQLQDEFDRSEAVDPRSYNQYADMHSGSDSEDEPSAANPIKKEDLVDGVETKSENTGLKHESPPSTPIKKEELDEDSEEKWKSESPKHSPSATRTIKKQKSAGDHRDDSEERKGSGHENEEEGGARLDQGLRDNQGDISRYDDRERMEQPRRDHTRSQPSYAGHENNSLQGRGGYTSNTTRGNGDWQSHNLSRGGYRGGHSGGRGNQSAYGYRGRGNGDFNRGRGGRGSNRGYDARRW